MSGEKILLVDDTRLNLELAKELLELDGFRVIEAETGREALEKARTEQPEVIVLDIELPDMSGLAVVDRLKKDDQTRLIPVVALTGYSRADDRQRFLQAGFAGYILKPFDTKSFSRTIASFITPSDRT